MIKFYGILDFYPNRFQIKKEYDKLSLEEIIALRKEIYCMSWEQEGVKDLIWEFLNNDLENKNDLKKQFQIKKKKVKRYYK